MMGQKCMWCDKPSVRLCDAAIGFEATGVLRDKNGEVAHLLTDLRANHWTCDATMCVDHATQVGWVCGETPDSIDRCPYHVQHDEASMAALVMFASEVEEARRDIYARIRRSRMCRVTPITDEEA